MGRCRVDGGGREWGLGPVDISVSPLAAQVRGLPLPVAALILIVISLLLLMSIPGALVPLLGLVPGVREVARGVAPVVSFSASPPPAATVGGPGGVVVALIAGVWSLPISILASPMGLVAIGVVHPAVGATGSGVPFGVLYLCDLELVIWAHSHIIGHPVVV